MIWKEFSPPVYSLERPGRRESAALQYGSAQNRAQLSINRSPVTSGNDPISDKYARGSIFSHANAVLPLGGGILPSPLGLLYTRTLVANGDGSRHVHEPARTRCRRGTDQHRARLRFLRGEGCMLCTQAIFGVYHRSGQRLLSCAAHDGVSSPRSLPYKGTGMHLELDNQQPPPPEGSPRALRSHDPRCCLISGRRSPWCVFLCSQLMLCERRV